MKSGFLDKLLERLDRVTPDEMQAHFARLAGEKLLLESVFQALREGVVILDDQGRITWLNASAGHLFGISQESAIGATLESRVRGFDWTALTGHGGPVSRDMEVFYPERRFLNVYLAPIATEHAASAGYVMLVRDVTQSRRMTEEMIESERISALTLLAAGVAHELGNPLNSLTIHLQLLDRKLKAKDPRLHDELGELITTARGELERLDSIIEQFLGAVRPTTPRLEPCDLNQLVADALDFLRPEIGEFGAEVSFRPHTPMPVQQLDSPQIKQAIYNVIRNAAQAVAPNGGRVELATDCDDHGARLTVRDNGSGIAAADLARVFTPYHTTKSRGHGLGLLIVRRIMREHGGDISLESEEGRGTTVTLRLPFSRPRMRLLEGPARDRRKSTSRRGGSAPAVIDINPVSGRT